MGLVIGVFGIGDFLSKKIMAAVMIDIWIIVVAHGWTDPLNRGVKIIRKHIM